MKKRVAIIGAGVSGLPAIKCCLDENLEPVCFERTGDIGGTWNYEQGLKHPKMISVMSSTVANSSKAMSCYSDFPYPKEFPLFVPHSKTLQYLKMYAENFDLTKHIRFNAEIIKVRQADDFADTGNWNVTWKDLSSSKEHQEIYNCVLMCSGKYTEPRMASYEGQEEFVGNILHSVDYKTYHGFENKTVVVVSIKNTGADIAAELSGLGSQVYLASRRGAWVGGRIVNGKGPGDAALCNRSFYTIMNCLPTTWSASLWRSGMNNAFDHSYYGIEPNHFPGIESGLFTANGILPERIISGKVVVKPNIRRFTKTAVIFEDGTTAENVDVVIFATGFDTTLPYLDCRSFEIRDNQIDLYRTMFAPDIQPSTIALIGTVILAGAAMPVVEMQCRVATRVFKGDIRLPTESEMRREIKLTKEAIRRKALQLKYNDPIDYMVGHYVPGMTTLAKMCGCCPSFFKLLLMDRRLAWSYLFGPVVPAQFRLCGHGAWEGAKETVLTVEERNLYPYRRLFQPSSSNGVSKRKPIWICIKLLAMIPLTYAFARFLALKYGYNIRSSSQGQRFQTLTELLLPYIHWVTRPRDI